MKVALFSAFPQELTCIIKTLGAKKAGSSHFSTWSADFASKEIMIVMSGMGMSNSESALNYAVEKYHPDCIISAGFGGALYKGAAIGDVIAASSVMLYPDIAEATSVEGRQKCQVDVPGVKDVMGRMTGAVTLHEGSLLTLGQRVDKATIDKKLLSGLSFPVCDMETFPLAKRSLIAGLPFFAIRAITALAHEEIPQELFGVTDASGNFNIFRALAIMLSKPSLLPVFVRMGRNARTASQQLSRVIETLLRSL
ncbi:MAG: hypothetical protein HQL08_06680 [Nitrospirae bacterium]|nr:hypothetical protein [Nitrospirota bacterium]